MLEAKGGKAERKGDRNTRHIKHDRPLRKAGGSMTTVKTVECSSGSCSVFHTKQPVGVGVGEVMPASFEFRSLREASDWEPDLGSLTRPVFSRFLSFPLLHLLRLPSHLPSFPPLDPTAFQLTPLFPIAPVLARRPSAVYCDRATTGVQAGRKEDISR